jgi:ComF family protein
VVVSLRIGAVFQALADFLVDERCHACGCDVASRAHLRLPEHPAAAALARPLDAVRVGRVAIRTRPLCGACARDLRPWPSPVCIPEPEDGDIEDRSGARRIHLDVFPAFEADAGLLSVVHLLKFARRRRVAPWLARAVAVGIAARALDADATAACLVPVPMDPASRRRRGFNQAALIAGELARIWGVPVVGDALVKIRRTVPQSSLDRDRRARNLDGAIAVGSGAGRVVGRTALLVDDLVTTGATAAACARTLAAAGARAVRVVCVGYRS